MTANTRKNVLPLIAVVVIVVGLFLAVLAATERPSLGLDLQGGVSVVLQPTLNGKKIDNVKKESLEQTKQIIEKRVNAIGVGEPDVTVQGSTIVVQIPGIKDQKRALALVGKTAELRFRPVLQNLSPTLSKADQGKITTLRKRLEIPAGVSSAEVLNSEFAARGMPTVPDQATTSTTTPAAAATPTTVAPAEAAPTTTPGTGTGGSRSAKVARLRSQSAPTTTAQAAPTTTTSTTTTTIDPTPKNQYKVGVFKDKKGQVVTDLQTLYQLEQQADQAGLSNTKPEGDIASSTVILNGVEQQKGGVTVTPRYQLGPTLLSGRSVEDASAGVDQSGAWIVNPTFKDGKTGIDLFNEAAAHCYNGDATCPTKQLGIVLDGVVISAPTIQQPSFTRNQIQISGSFDSNSANDLATALRYGSLPVTMTPQQVETVSATLGQGALSAALVAGAIGLGLVILYILFYYRLLGLVTFGALAMAGMSMWIVISFFGATQGLTLTLSGIVGIIVSIGVSLDSSVVFYENLKEDVRSGRSMKAAVDRSFSTAYGTILKADFSSLIGAVVLYLLSIGPVRGFAFYLGLSTVLDLVMAYFFTRPAVAILANSKWGNRPGLFGIPTDDLQPAGVGRPAAGGSAALTMKSGDAVMGALRGIYRNTNDIDFPKIWRPFLIASAVIVLVSIVSLFTRGLNLAIDFKGGSVWEVPSKTMTSAQATDVLAQFNNSAGSKVQVVTDAKGTRILRVQADSTDIKESQRIGDAFAKKAGVKPDDVGTNTVGPSWGSEITRQALKSLVIFLVLISAYISWQLEWRMAVAALIAVLHDVIVTVGIYSIFQFQVTPATVISFLTILGYSLYDTIVVFDRMQENSARYDRSGQYTYTAIMRRSMNQVLMRSVNTTTVSLLPVLSMLLIGSIAFGQAVIGDFSLALFIGLLSGAYSSIFVAAPIVAILKEREPKYRRVRQRVEDRGTLAEAEHILVSAKPGAPLLVGASAAPVADGASPVPAPDAKETAATARANKAAQYQRPHPPRPRKQKRR